MIDSVMYLWDSFVYLFAFVLVLSVVVVVHEWGHFIVARLCGIKVTHFSIGFGRVLWHRTDKKGTRWQVCLLPLGGYVKMLGDEDAASAKTNAEKVPAQERKYMFATQALWKKAAVIAAGPGMNYVFAIVLLTGLLFVCGRGVMPPVIGEFLEDSVAREAGMMVGDRVVMINGHEVKEWSDILRLVRLSEFGKELVVEADRNGEMLTFRMTPHAVDNLKDNFPRIGIISSPELFFRDDNIGLGQAAVESVKTVAKLTADTTIYLGQILFNHRSADGMRGPLGIAEMSGDAMKGGVAALLFFIVNISVAIGFMNLLPIPVLDGGHLMFYAIEAVIRRPVPEGVQNALLWGGMSLLFGLLMFTMYLDVPRIVQRIFG
ncbi:MAG: M50 family metallopeptidase [Alphaproteobacteria bacterium]